jgi:regulator of cell morphogenesis and NO signaling
MMINTEKSVRDIALEQPTSIRVFERLGIDYCCGGRKPLAEACSDRNLEISDVVVALDYASQLPAPAGTDWTQTSLGQLIRHIESTHHEYVKNELPRLAMLAQKVVNRHGDTQVHLPVLKNILAQLDEELIHHLGKEEHILFPYITKLEEAQVSGSEVPHGCFGTVTHPIAMMISEHDAAGELLAQIEKLTSNFTTPEGACPTYLAFYTGLKEFQQDLHQHIHLENNILFPRAIALELATVLAEQPR